MCTEDLEKSATVSEIFFQQFTPYCEEDNVKTK